METLAIVIPCYKVRDHILRVLNNVPDNIDKIYLIDDGCPEKTGEFVSEQSQDPRIEIVYHPQNRGVGAAVVTGYEKALKDNHTCIIKIDGDDQMDLSYLPRMIKPVLDGRADYVKGNRFFSPDMLRSMPAPRLFGNACLSFINKLTSGYWNIMDPTNGYTAIHGAVLKTLPLHKIDNGYFFESDMLYQLSLVRAKVLDIPMASKYDHTDSSLSIPHVFFTFPLKYMKRFLKRIFYNYFLRDFNLASLLFIAGTSLLLFGIVFGAWHWIDSIVTGVPATSGTVMLAAFPSLLGIQFLLSALSYDVSHVPQQAISPFTSYHHTNT